MKLRLMLAKVLLLAAVCGHEKVLLVSPHGTAAAAVAGGLDLSGRALVAVPQPNHRVFLTWRYLKQDGAGISFDVFRSTDSTTGFTKIRTASQTTTYGDSPGAGTFYYRVVPTGGVPSGAFEVTTDFVGRDWVEIMPAARGRKLQFSERHFADTDGDGELEFVTYYPQVPSYRGGAAEESYKLQVYELFENVGPRWTYDTGMGLQTNPSSGDSRSDWDYEWTFKPVAWDIDGDFAAEIITLSKIAGEYRYVVLKDAGDTYQVLGQMDSPIPVADLDNNSRHFPFFARLGGANYSFCLQGGTYRYWEMWTYDWNGSGFTQRWHVRSTDAGFEGNRSSSHTVLVADLDGDGRDEISNGATVLDDDGSVLWHANAEFGGDMHVDGQVIDDIDPLSPGLELMIHAEWGAGYALYGASSGALLWLKNAPGSHLQLNIASNITGGAGLDCLGTYGGHRPSGGFACAHDGTDLAYPYADMPANGDRWWAMDWDGARGRNTCMNFTKVYGLGDEVIYEVDLRDAPAGDVVPVNEHYLNHLWFNVDIVGDYREDIPVQMKDGSVRVYVNTRTPPARLPCKWQSVAYQMMQAPGDYRYFVRAVDEPEADLSGNEPPYVYAGRDQAGFKAEPVQLDAAVMDDGAGAPSVVWSKVAGPGEVTFADARLVDTTASFSELGTYVLRLAADDGGLTGSDEVVVTVTSSPADTVSSPSVGSGKAYEWFSLNAGEELYIDRAYVYVSFPQALDGHVALRTANDDKFSSTAGTFVSFDVNRDATVHVLFTRVNTTLEADWLNDASGWELESFTVETTVGGAEATRHVRKKSFTAGSTVELAGNGSTSTSSMYTVVVVPEGGAPAPVDSDGDGLTDAEEVALGTSPHDPDSDRDGMPDGWEVANGLDPKDGSDGSLDPDGDGVTNRDEFLRGTDPQVRDSAASDGRGCALLRSADFGELSRAAGGRALVGLLCLLGALLSQVNRRQPRGL